MTRDRAQPVRDALLLAYILLTFYVLGCLAVENDVYYPAWRHVGSEAFAAFHAAVEAALGPVMFGPMMAQIALGAIVLALGSARVSRMSLGALVALNVYLVVESVLVQVPIHGALARGYDAALIERLIWTHRAYRLPAEIAMGIVAVAISWRVMRAREAPST